MSVAAPRGLLRSVRRQAAPLLKTGLLKSGGLALLRACVPSRRVAILRYHAVCDEDGYAYAEPGICVSPRAFECHVRYLAAHYSVLPLTEVVTRLKDGRPLPTNTVVITFDDGYADNLQAARVLARFGLSATFYLTTGCLAEGEPFWPSEIRMLVAALPAGPLRLALPDSQLEIPIDDAPTRVLAIRALNRICKSYPIPVRDAVREELRIAAGRPPWQSPMLSWSQVDEMHRLGMTLGAHTETHANLPSAGLTAAQQEIRNAKRTLEDRIGGPVTMFSYPNGGAERYMTADLQRAVAAAGYHAATTSQNGFADRNSDLFALARVEIEERLEDLIFALEVERFAMAPRPGPASMGA